MNVYLLLLMIIGNFIFQSTILQHFRISGILPNTTLIIVLTVSILYGKKKGVIAGSFAGILQDLFFSKAIGINILIYTAIAYFVGGIENKVFKDNFVTPTILILSSTLFYHSLYFVLMYFLKHSISYLTIFKSIIIGEAVYNLVVGIIFYRIFYKRVYSYR